MEHKWSTHGLGKKYISINEMPFLKIVILSLLTCSIPLNAVETELTEEKTYCLRWADRFLSIKDGQNYRGNKISAAKFPMYVDICLQNYDELQQYYENLQKQNQMKKE